MRLPNACRRTKAAITPNQGFLIMGYHMRNIPFFIKRQPPLGVVDTTWGSEVLSIYRRLSRYLI